MASPLDISTAALAPASLELVLLLMERLVAFFELEVVVGLARPVPILAATLACPSRSTLIGGFCPYLLLMDEDAGTKVNACTAVDVYVSSRAATANVFMMCMGVYGFGCLCLWEMLIKVDGRN